MGISTIVPATGGDYTTLAAWATAVHLSGAVESAQCFVGDCGSLSITGVWGPADSAIFTDASAKHNGKDQGTTGLAFAGDIDIQAGTSWAVRDMLIQTRLRYKATVGDSFPVVLFERNLIVTSSGAITPLDITCAPNNAGNPSDLLTATVRNNIVIVKGGTMSQGFIVLADATAAGASAGAGVSIEIYNNTLHTSATVANGLLLKALGGGIGTSTGITAYIVNNAVFAYTTEYAKSNSGAGSSSPTISQFDTNASSDGTAGGFGGSGNLTSQVSSDWFSSPVSDLSLLTTSPGKNTGMDQSSTGFSDDIIGTTRPQGAFWDIGAFEFIPPGGGGSTRFISWPGLI